MNERLVFRAWFVALFAGAALGLVQLSARAADEIAAPTENSPDEPLASAPSLGKAARFLDGVALDWTKRRQCGTCHTNYAYLLARPALREFESPAMPQIREFFEGRVAHWDDNEKSAKPRWDTEVVATAATLALNDAKTTGKLHPMTRKALDRMWTLQRPDGTWNWLKCNWPPLEHDDYYGAVYAALGVGHAPEGYARAESAAKGLEKLRTYLQNTPPPDLHHKTFLLWASLGLDGLMSREERTRTIQQLRDLQRTDGGWNLPSLGNWKRHDDTPNDKAANSDGYATGLVVYVLREAGVSADDPAVVRAVGWLKKNQRASGRWFTRSLNTDSHHYIANAGTGFAVMALKACEPGGNSSKLTSGGQ